MTQALRSTSGIIGATIVLVLVAIGLAAPWIAPFDPLTGHIEDARQAPSSVHWFGTDQLGRDILSRVMYGSLISLRAGILVVLIAVLIGFPIGLVSGYVGGVPDLVAQRFVDAMMAFPGVLLAVLIVAVVGVSLESTIVAIGVVSIPSYVRLARGSVFVERERDYIVAARAIGLRPWRVLVHQLLPNVLPPIAAQVSLTFAFAITAVAGLSFIGLGARPPTPEWGAMLSQGYEYIRTSPHMVIFPGMAIALAVLGLNTLGDAIGDELSHQD